MRFNNVKDLQEYLLESESKNGSVEYIDVDVKYSQQPIKECVECKQHTVKITSLFDAPEIHNKSSLKENEIFVESIDVIKDACGTGKLELLGRTMLINVCESEGTVHVNLDIEVDGIEYNKVPFTVKLTEDKNSYIMLNKTTLV